MVLKLVAVIEKKLKKKTVFKNYESVIAERYYLLLGLCDYKTMLIIQYKTF